jgi:hypothetical protein
MQSATPSEMMKDGPERDVQRRSAGMRKVIASGETESRSDPHKGIFDPADPGTHAGELIIEKGIGGLGRETRQARHLTIRAGPLKHRRGKFLQAQAAERRNRPSKRDLR